MLQIEIQNNLTSLEQVLKVMERAGWLNKSQAFNLQTFIGQILMYIFNVIRAMQCEVMQIRQPLIRQIF